MPDPVTMLAIGAGAAALSGVVGAVGAINAGQAEANAAEYQADVYRQQAAQERQASQQEAADYRREQSRLFAKRRAILGGSGVDIGSGSPLLASEDFAAEAEYQAKKIEAGGEIKASRLGQQAGLYDAQASNAKTGSYWRAGSLLLQGGGSAATLWGKRPVSGAAP